MSELGPAMLLPGAPNISEGRDGETIDALTAAVAAHATILDIHSDPEYNRTVITAAAAPEALAAALGALAAAVLDRIDVCAYDGLHPHAGALDVCPVLWVHPDHREAARRTALGVAAAIAALDIPVFLYGELASTPERRERAYFRRGGPAELGRRIESGEVLPDLGPAKLHERAGATLVTARAPLVAFNVELDTPDLAIAQAVAAGLREAGGGLPGVRAIGVALEGGRTQVSTNVQDPVSVPLARLIDEIRRIAAPHGSRPVEAELIGLMPEAALAGYPEDVPIAGFDPARHLLERRLREIGD